MELVERHEVVEKGPSELSLMVKIEHLVFFEERG